MKRRHRDVSERDHDHESVCKAALAVNKTLEEQLASLQVGAVSYFPTVYAADCYEKFLRKYGDSHKRVLFLGVNPGPWGMSQTGVPFGEISSVRDWLQIEGTVNKPPKEVPGREILGFDCKRTEISGQRFWGLIKEICETPENFFSNCIVLNYCPVQFMTASGRNITPNELKINERDRLYQICDEALLKTLRIYKIEIVVCIGKLIETRVNRMLKDNSCAEEFKVVSIPHPSPRSVGNTNWSEKAAKCLEDLDLLKYLKSTSPYWSDGRQ